MFVFAALLRCLLATFAVFLFGRAMWVSNEAVTTTFLGKIWNQARFDDLVQVKVFSSMGSPVYAIDLFTPNTSGAAKRLRASGSEWVSLDPLRNQMSQVLQRRPELLTTRQDVENWRRISQSARPPR